MDVTEGHIKMTAVNVDLTVENYRFLQEYIQRESGIVLESDKRYLLEARLGPVALRHTIPSLDDLCALLRATATPDLRQQVVEAMTTNETFFFRDPAQYEALRTVILPDLMTQHQSTRTLSFWSAAASTGQEAYSLAMLLLDMGLEGWKIQILGTDISEHVLERAKSGRYMQIEVNRGLPAKYLVKYFTRVGLEWQLNEQVRRMVRFDRFDLRQPMTSKGPFDVVFCRNVLIYFNLDTRKHILREVRRTLCRQGYLLLGGAESTFSIDDQFQRRTIGKAVAYQAP